MKTTHTHRGTCQACGARQAVDNRGLRHVAKHGYQVRNRGDWGFFVGTCHGSDHQPAEHDIALTRSILISLAVHAKVEFKMADDLASGAEKLTGFSKSVWNRTLHKYEVEWVDITAETDERIVRTETAKAINEHKRRGSSALDHIDYLNKFVIPRLGQLLYAVADEVKPVKPTQAKVDIKTGTIDGFFRTKAAQKDALDKIGREFAKARHIVLEAVLGIDYNARTEAQNSVYNSMPYDLHNYRNKHGVLVLEVFPHLVATVAEMSRLYALRTEVKSRPVTK